MPLTLPEPDTNVIENKKQIVNDLKNQFKYNSFR